MPICSVKQPSFLHDFAVTERYAILPEIQIVMNPMGIVVGGGAPVGADFGMVARTSPRCGASSCRGST